VDGAAQLRGSSHRSFVVTEEEALWISEHRLPGVPPEDEITAWRACRPPPEPARRGRGLDTAPAAGIDWALVIRQAILGERAHMVEAVGQAIGEHGNGLLTEVEGMIAQAAEQVRAELRAEIDQMRAEFFNRLDLVRGQGVELRAQLEAAIAKKKRARPTAQPNGGSLLQLPAPALADASLAPDALAHNPTNGDGRPQ
jgi:hypothetical protein